MAKIRIGYVETNTKEILCFACSVKRIVAKPETKIEISSVPQDMYEICYDCGEGIEDHIYV